MKMDESEDNLSNEETIYSSSPSLEKAKPKKRSLVERELETNLTTRITSPITNIETTSTSRYGRARKLKRDLDSSSSEKVETKIISPKFEKSPTRPNTAYKMHASNSPLKGNIQLDGLDNQIENIYNENISLSRFSSDKKKGSSSAKKQAKIYIRKDLIQNREKDETIMLIKNMFSPTHSSQANCESNSASKVNFISKKPDLSSVVKTLDFDGNKKKKREGNDKRMTQSDLFDLEAKCEYQVGDLAWARMGTYPFWPCIVTREPSSNMFVKKRLHGRLERDIIHVTFLGDNGRRSWIMDSMLRKYQGLLEFENTREQFSSEKKRKDPRLYSAFFISEKKLPNWYSSVEEAEVLLKEPKRLRIDTLSLMLSQPKQTSIPTKSNRITRTNSDVSLSESLYDSLFSEDDCKNSDSESTKSKSRNKSFDVSDVVTACLDSMAAKTGITKIQKQSHMDRWLQKAKSNTPEKPISKPQVKSEKKNTVNKNKNVPTGRKRYSLRNCYEENDVNHTETRGEPDYSLHTNGHIVIDEIDLVDSGGNLSHDSCEPGSGIGIISKVETLVGKEMCNNVSENVPNFIQSNNEGIEMDVNTNKGLEESVDVNDYTSLNQDKLNFDNSGYNHENMESTEEVSQENDNCDENYTVAIKENHENDISTNEFTDSETDKKNDNISELSSKNIDDPIKESINNDEINCDESKIVDHEETKDVDTNEFNPNIDLPELSSKADIIEEPMDVDMSETSVKQSDIEKILNENNYSNENVLEIQESISLPNQDSSEEDNINHVHSDVQSSPFEKKQEIRSNYSDENETEPNNHDSVFINKEVNVYLDINQPSIQNELLPINNNSPNSNLIEPKLNDDVIENSNSFQNDEEISSNSNNLINNEVTKSTEDQIHMSNVADEDLNNTHENKVLNGHISPLIENEKIGVQNNTNTEETTQNSEALLLPIMNGVDSAEFLKYVERKQDDLIDEHPELSPEEITNYLYKTWQYEESLKTDRKKTDDIQLSNLVKGLQNTSPSVRKGRKRILQLKSGKDKTKQTLINFVQKQEKSTFISEACNIKSTEKETEHGIDRNEKLSNISNDDKTMDKASRPNNVDEVDKVLVIEDYKITNNKSDMGDNQEDDQISNDTAFNKITINGDASNITKNSDVNDDTEGIEQTRTNSNIKSPEVRRKKEDILQSNNMEDISAEEKSNQEPESISASAEENNLDKEIASINSSMEYDNYKPEDDVDSSDSDISGIASGDISPLSFDGNSKKNVVNEELDKVSLNSENSEISLSKRKAIKERPGSKSQYDNPEFLKYLELRQDALMDEHPELSQDEITFYLYNTWLYEEGLKTDRKKTDDLDQANLVKGLNQEVTVPAKRIRKKKEKFTYDKAEEVIPKDKSKRRTERQFYKEDFSDTEDDVEYFEIFNMKGKKSTSNQSSSKEPKVEDKNTASESKTEVVENDYIDEADQFDQVEEYFRQLTQPKRNLFKGLIRERVCEICEKMGNLVKCKGCSGMFHIDCASKVVEVTDSPQPTKGRKKKQKKRGRKPKGFDDSNDDHSDDRNEHNNSEDYEVESRTIANADEFEEKLSTKLKEMHENAKYDSNSSDEELNWSDTEVGKCKVVDVIPKQKKSEAKNFPDFKCKNCEKYAIPVCFVCKSIKSPKKQIEYRQKCQVAHCNQFYHLECLEHWPQTQFSSGECSRSKKNSELFEALTCPRHVCHTCVCDDPRGCKTRFSGDKLARCVRCPATYHTFTKCLPAGSQILTGSNIICPRHYENRPGKVPCHVNTGWCFICALGGTLICCEYCPTSFHAECLNIKPPEEGYMCEDCETGCLPLYGEMVWVKLGHYRWWPGLILHPSEIPENILAVKHYPGEFVVRFFGQYDHYWVNRGRVFPFQEGDTGKISSKNSKIDAAFSLAVEHAQRAYDIIKAAPPTNEGDEEIASSLLPPHYVKLKVNKPLGALANKRVEDEHSLTQCECDPAAPQPCGPYSHCLNRMLLTECGPSCRAGERCCNRAFERREYPRMQPARTSARGWGLRTLEPIAAGQFVIEYVGELIDEEEFQRRMKRKHEVRDENYYFLTLDKERMIDAGPKGNLARFMNHSCEPNCETQKWTVLGDVRVGLFALYDIPANSELTFNYNLECAGIEKKRCLCGTKRCSGFMGAKPKQDESQTKKNKVAAKRTYKKRKPISIELSPTTSQKTKRGKPKNRELTEIEKDLLIIKSATNGMSSDSESSGRLNSMDSVNSLKRKRQHEETNDVSSQSAKKSKLEKNYDGD